MRTVTVASTYIDPLHYATPKYTKNNLDCVCLGVNPDAVKRDTSPNLDMLNPFAAWLFLHVPTSVYGNMLPRRNECVRCYSDKTEGAIRRERVQASKNPRLIQQVEDEILSYDWDNTIACITSWHFSKIRRGQSDEEYWNTEAAKIYAAGVRRVVIGDHELTIFFLIFQGVTL